MHARAESPSLRQVVGEVVDLTAALSIFAIPLLTTALPGVILFLLLPALLLLAVAALPVALAGALLAPPYLLLRSVRRRVRHAL